MTIEQDIDVAFRASFDMDTWEFELEWYNYIKKKQRWNFLMDLNSYFWGFILLLFIVGFIIIRIRNKRTLKRWELEEQEDSETW